MKINVNHGPTFPYANIECQRTKDCETCDVLNSLGVKT